MQLEAALERQRELMRFQLKDEKYGDEKEGLTARAVEGIRALEENSDARERFQRMLDEASFRAVQCSSVRFRTI